MEHDGTESRAKTLVIFGIGLVLMIVAIIAVAALLGM
jgi:hypothetical protein